MAWDLGIIKLKKRPDGPATPNIKYCTKLGTMSISKTNYYRISLVIISVYGPQ